MVRAMTDNSAAPVPPLFEGLRRLLAPLERRWSGLSPMGRGILLVSTGSLTLVLMGTAVKWLGDRLPSFELLFFRSFVGFFFVLPVFWRDPLAPFRTKRFGMHFVRGAIGSAGNMCFFWTLTHMLLADAMAIQFSRPLFMIPLALLFLREQVGLQRVAVAVVGFFGILLYARPFTAGFDPNALVGAAGAMFGGLVIVCIKRLSTTESTATIMFYYAFWNAVLVAVPTYTVWVTPQGHEWLILLLIGMLGIGGQAMVTAGLRLGDTTALTPLDYSRVLYSAVIGFAVFGELPGLWSLAGMAIILGASLYLVLTERRRAA